MNSLKIGTKIRTARKAKGLSVDTLAEKLDISRASLYSWENDEFSPSFAKIEKLAAALGVPMSYFIGETAVEIVKTAVGNVTAPVDEAAEFRLFKRFRELMAQGVDLDRIIEEQNAPLRIRQPERRPRYTNRRDELPVYHISESGKGGKVPKWLNLAAGDGSDLELSDEFLYFEEIKAHAGLHAAVIRGESMCDTLVPGDVVVLEEMPGGVWELPPLDGDVKNSYLVAKSKVAHDDICVLSINDDAPTIKRVGYDVSRGLNDWQMLILAENPSVWPARAVTKRDHVKFHAKMLGIAEKLPRRR